MNRSSSFDAALHSALDHALAYLETLEDGPISASLDLETIRQRLQRPLPNTAMDATQVLDELVADAAGGLIGSGSGRFFGWVIGGALPAALAADWITSAWDQNAATYACGPAVAVMEEIAGQWLKMLLGLPATAGFAFTTGSQMAHMLGLAAARHALLERQGWDVERRGLTSAPAIRILSSNQRHGSIERAVRLLGLGTDQVVDLAVDSQGRLPPELLATALAREPERPTIVILQAGDLNIGAFDPFAELIPLAHAHEAWVHVDGRSAYGHRQALPIAIYSPV